VVNQFEPVERERFDAMVRSEIVAAFGEDEQLAVSEVAGPDVMLVRAQFVDMELGNERRADVDQVSVLSTSRFRLFLDLSDSVSGESLLRQVDFRRVMPTSLGDPGPQPPVRPVASRVSSIEERAALRHAIGNRAKSLRERFDWLREAGELPQPRHARP
jgi:hypothetical protein